LLADGLKYLRLDDAQQGEILLGIPVPHTDDPWGALAPLRGTVWADQIPVVKGSVMSDAMHGWATGLMRVIGPEPKYLLGRITEAEGRCSLVHECAMVTPHCYPCQKLPDCYEAPLSTPDASHVAALVAMAWKEGRYIVVVEGREWSVR